MLSCAGSRSVPGPVEADERRQVAVGGSTSTAETTWRSLAGGCSTRLHEAGRLVAERCQNQARAYSIGGGTQFDCCVLTLMAGACAG